MLSISIGMTPSSLESYLESARIIINGVTPIYCIMIETNPFAISRRVHTFSNNLIIISKVFPTI